jgi:hypothetical protein
MADDAVFSPAQLRTLTAVLDEIVPARPDGALPGAGTLGVTSYVEKAVRERPELAFGLVPGLEALERAAVSRGAAGFAALPAAERAPLLREVAAAEAALVPTLMFVTYSGYYHESHVLTALGLEARPPHPKGYDLPPNDLSLLDPVRRRGKIYREA